jgi:hypothetical protein
MPTPAERPDLYDFYDALPSAVPLTVEYLLSITPDHIKAAIEKKTGKPFTDVAQTMVDERSASQAKNLK